MTETLTPALPTLRHRDTMTRGIHSRFAVAHRLQLPPRMLRYVLILIFVVGCAVKPPAASPGSAKEVVPVPTGDIVSAANDTTCAVLGGAAWCWGQNSLYGNLGTGAKEKLSATPVKVKGLEKGVTAIAVGYGHSCAVKDGGAWCWGDNRWGQLGNGTKKASGIPVAIESLKEGVTAIAVKQFHSCAVAKGSAWCWGRGVYGQLGNGHKTDSLVPVRVEAIANVTAISVGAHFSCAIVAGAVKCWGQNLLGQLGVPGAKDSALPLAVGSLKNVSALASDTDQTCAITDGTLSCWGNLIPDLIYEKGKDKVARAPRAISGLAGISSIAIGNRHACALARTGSVKCWGENSAGELGTGVEGNAAAPGAVRGLVGATGVATGLRHSCALVGGKTLCWGNNCWGQLGNGAESCPTFNAKRGERAPVEVSFR